MREVNKWNAVLSDAELANESYFPELHHDLSLLLKSLGPNDLFELE